MATLIVENTEARVHMIADLPLKKSELPDALMPGINEVDTEVWNGRAMKIPLVQYLVKSGVLKIGKGSAPESLSELKVQDALDLVSRTVDRQLLERWFDGEGRKTVLEAIEKQLEATTPKPPKGGGGEE